MLNRALAIPCRMIRMTHWSDAGLCGNQGVQSGGTMADDSGPDILQLTTKIVSAHISNNHVGMDALRRKVVTCPRRRDRTAHYRRGRRPTVVQCATNDMARTHHPAAGSRDDRQGRNAVVRHSGAPRYGSQKRAVTTSVERAISTVFGGRAHPQRRLRLAQAFESRQR